MQLRLRDAMIEQARLGKCVVVMDEAQNLDHLVLELIRMLSNFETLQQKLPQLILVFLPGNLIWGRWSPQASTNCARGSGSSPI